MNDLISRAALFELVCEKYSQSKWGHAFTEAAYMVATEIENAPSVEAAPVVRSEWITNSDRPDTLICKHCDTGFDMWKHESEYFHHCPSCGARMDGESNG